MNKDKNYIAKNDFLKDILVILRETFEGSPEGQPSVYLDRGIGFFNTIENLSSQQVSIEINGTTVAAQTEHAKFYLDRLCEFMTGRTEAVNWEQSWLIETVNQTEWDALRESVKKSYENVLRTIAGIEVWDTTNAGEPIAIIAHTAYHLGAIRQIIKGV
jgi:hypothetical protein